MRQRFLGASLLLAVIVALPAWAQRPGQKKTLPAVDAEKIAATKIAGKLLSTPGSDRTFTIQVTYQRLVPRGNGRGGNRNSGRQYQQIMRMQQQMARARSPQQAMRAMQSMQRSIMQMKLQAARSQQNNFQVVSATQDVTVQATATADVRTMVLPENFDDKGNVKRYSASELRKLKGKKSSLPGYESSMENLQAGQIVEVSLVHHHSTTATVKTKAAKDVDKDVDKATGGEEKRIQARLIVIVKDSDGTQTPAQRRGKKR